MGVARKHLLFVSVSSFMLKGLLSVCLAPIHSVLKSVKNVSFQVMVPQRNWIFDGVCHKEIV